MKSNPSEAHIFMSGKNIFLALESGSGNTFFPTPIFLVYALISLGSAYSTASALKALYVPSTYSDKILKYHRVENQAHFGEGVVDLSLADAVIFGESLGAEIINLQVIDG